MAAKPSIPLKVRAEARRLRATGMSFAQVAEKCAKIARRPVSEASVRKWCKDSEAEPQAPPSSVPAPAQDEPTTPELSDDPLAVLRELVVEHKALAALARRDGNAKAAAQALAAAGKAADTLARLESKRVDGAGAGSVTYTREQIEAEDRAIDERLALLDADLKRCGGLVCPECGRRIRIELASRPQGQDDGKDTDE